MKHFKPVLGVLTRPEVYLSLLFPLLAIALFAVIPMPILARFHGREYSHADLLIYALFPFYFLPLFTGSFWAVMVSVFLRHDFDPVSIIRYRSRQAFWLTQAGKTALFCVLYALFLTAAVAVLGAMTTEMPVNFTDENSYFFKEVGMKMEQNPNIVLMHSVFFLMAFLPLLPLCLLPLLTKWLWDSAVFGVLIVLAISLADAFIGQSFLIWKDFDGLLFWYCYPAHERWVYPSNLFTKVWIPILWSVVLLVLGFLVSKRKEFLHVQQK